MQTSTTFARLTAKTITRAEILALMYEAGSAGDDAQVRICKRALDGSDRARAECARVINDTSAQED